MKYNTPTIGLQFTQSDFVKFCKAFETYLLKTFIESPDNYQEEFSMLGGAEVNFPIGKLDNLVVFFQHYSNIDAAISKWNERKERINLKKIFFIFFAYDDTPIEVLKEFESLPLPNKLLLTNSKRVEAKSSFALEYGNRQWFDICNNFTQKKYYQKFNFIDWFYNILRNNESV